MRRSTVVWLIIAGLSAIVRYILSFGDVVYYDPVSVLDYSAVVTQSAAGIASGVALMLLWRDPPVRRGSVLLPVAALAVAGQGVGNLLEDAFDVGWGEFLFVFGGVGTVFTLAAAGVAAMSDRSPWRWTGIFLVLGATGGMLGVGLAVMGASWIAFAVWIWRNLEQPR